MEHKYTFEKVQAFLDNNPVLHLKDVEKIDFQSAYELVENILFKNKKTPTSFPDETEQCPKNKIRSIGDIYSICKYYKPDITFEEVYNSLVSLAENGRVQSFACNNVKKRTWRIMDGFTSGVFNRPVDEFGFTYPEKIRNKQGVPDFCPFETIIL